MEDKYVPKEYQCNICKKSPYDCECIDDDVFEENQTDYYN